MPARWDPPLPAVPPSYDPATMAAFILGRRPQEVVDLVAGITAIGPDIYDGSLDPVTYGIRDIAAEHPGHAAEIVELMASNADPMVRAQIPCLFDAVLGRGIDRMEEIAWDELLQDPDDHVFIWAFSVLHEMVDVGEHRTGPDFTWTDVGYDHIFGGDRWPERLTHYLKLGRVLSRHEAIKGRAPR